VTEARFAIGQTVRWSAELTHGWYEGRAADGVSYAQGAQIGRIADVCDEGGYCGTCDASRQDCPGPWYVVDFGDGPAEGLGGMYAQHELEAA
jgi:hypothetical protein